MSDKARWEKVNRFLDEALLLSADERKNWIETINEPDPSLKREVVALLGALENVSQVIHSKLGISIPLLLPPEFKAGFRVGDFLVRKILGRGAMAVVYLAWQISLEREVAIKVTRIAGGEAKTLAKLGHENIVNVYSEETDADAQWHLISMQYIAGTTLGDSTLNRCVEKMLPVFVQIASALEYAHANGVLHLDIKPANILLNNFGKAYLSDFNVSFQQEYMPDMRKPLLGGTEKYMSPEQKTAMDDPSEINLSNIDMKSDLYSFGIVMKEWFSTLQVENSNLNSCLLHLIQEMTEQDKVKRLSSSSELLSKLIKCKQIMKMENDLKPEAAWIRLLKHFPKAALFLFVFAPQFFAGMVNLFYNKTQVVDNLSVTQQAVFKNLALLLNPFIYTVAIVILMPYLFAIYKFLNGTNLIHEDKIYRYPKYLFWIITISWGTAFLYFPVNLTLFTGNIAFEVWWHFAISFFLSWLISVSYTILLTEFALVKLLYPKWIYLTKNTELFSAKIIKRKEALSKRYMYLSASIPMLAAVVLLLLGNDLASFRVLLTSLIGCSLIGFIMNLTIYQEYIKTISKLPLN